MNAKGAAAMTFHFFWELLLHVPAMLKLRRLYRRDKARTPHREPWVVCVSDNLDEVNGIALASRIQLRELRKLGKPAFLYGVAFHTRSPRREEPDGAIVLAPGKFSADQAGYDHSEVVVPRLPDFLAFLAEHRIDVLEMETPGPVSVACVFVAKVVGIKTLSHYRTDIITYSEMLVPSRIGSWAVQVWTRLVTRWAGPVIVPSEAYRDKVKAMGVPAARIHKLPRGVDLTAFHPGHRDRASWTDVGARNDGFLLLYVGRVSAEKNLAAFIDAFPKALERRPDLRLMVVGDGPLRGEMEARLAPTGRAHFTGVLTGAKLARAFASADLFVFPSLTDTFGNSVIEALASGLPCLVSDSGGPQEIIEPGVCGDVFRHAEPTALRDGMLALADDPEKLARYREAARQRAETFTYENAALAFWKLYQSLHHEH